MADIIDLILGDHQRIRRLMAALDQARCHPQGPRSARAVADRWEQLAGLLDRHTRAEEEICYLPMSGSGLAATGQLADARADHADIREAAAEARLQPAGSAPWWRAAGFALAACTGHLSHEESGVLAPFARRADPALRHTLGRQWLAFCTAWAPQPGFRGAGSCPVTAPRHRHRPRCMSAPTTGREKRPWRG